MIELLAVILAGFSFGIAVGIGVAVGLELVMRATGDGRTVLLTWARTRHREDQP